MPNGKSVRVSESSSYCMLELWGFYRIYTLTALHTTIHNPYCLAYYLLYYIPFCLALHTTYTLTACIYTCLLVYLPYTLNACILPYIPLLFAYYHHVLHTKHHTSLLPYILHHAYYHHVPLLPYILLLVTQN